MADSPQRKRLIVIGAGFAGLNLVKGLHGLPLDIFLIDKHNYSQFQPLLYQVATGMLGPSDVARPLRGIFRKHETVFVKEAEVVKVDGSFTDEAGNSNNLAAM